MSAPYIFDEFLASGLEESISPFLTSNSRKWGKNLSLKSALSAALFLALAFGLSFIHVPASYFFLSLVYFLSGTPALLASIGDLKNLEINIDVLMTTAAFVAILLDSSLEGALLLVLFELSHGMEDAVSRKAKGTLHNLNFLAPKFATLVASDGTFYEKSIREIPLSAHIFVKNGEIVPLDGTVINGTSSVDLVHLTGESLPVSKTVGDTVPAGARNLEGALTLEVIRTSGDSTLARIIQLITQATDAKPRLQRWLDRFGKTYASSIIALTFAFALFLPLVFSMPYLGNEGSIYRALAFLIAASPCALIIATPTAYLSAISACARKGVLLKGGITLDALTRCSTIAFDKTGTLTLGTLTCTAMEPPSDKALAIAYGLERHVVHPIATAICNFALAKHLQPTPISSFKATPGFGLEGTVDSIPVSIGLPPKGTATAAGELLALLTIGTQRFLFRFSDQIRPDTPALIRKLQQYLQPIMLTGDHPTNAAHIANLLGIERYFADLRPEDKLAKVAALSETGGLAMVGDGINDAPALARATVGISLARSGSATAIDASDVILLNDDLHLLPWLFSKAKSCSAIVKQNIALALSVICFATTPALLGLVPLWVAVLLHEGGTVLVGLNSLRLLRLDTKNIPSF